MLLKRVQFLSDYAENYLDKGIKIQEGKGFWGKMVNSFRKPEKRLSYRGPQREQQSVADLEITGFAGFCRIGKVNIFLKREDSQCEISLVENSQLWDLSDWGEDYAFITRFLAECYFMVTKDDYIIDEEESRIISALIGCLEPSYQEILDARNMVYWTLLEKVIEDDIVTDEEKATLAKIKQALDLSEENVRDLNLEALKQYYSSIASKIEYTQQDLTRLARIRKMAKRLGLNPKDLEA